MKALLIFCAACIPVFAWLLAYTGAGVFAAFMGFYAVMGAVVMTEIRRNRDGR